MKLAKHLLVYYTFQQEKLPEYNLYKYSEPYEQLTDVKIIHIIRGFPFDAMSGRYHFRFKSEFKEQNENVVAWIDILNLESKVPLFNGAVYVKVLEVGSTARNKLFSSDKLAKAVANLNRPQQPKPPVKNPPAPAPPVSQEKSASPQPVVAQKRKENSPPQQKIPEQSDSIFDEVVKPKNSAEVREPQPAATNIDLMFLSSVKPAATTMTSPTFTAQSTKPTEMTTEEKLENFNESVRNEEREKENDMKARLQLDESIEKWAYTAKVRNNFRTLLVTVQEMWPYGNWTPVQLSQLLTDKDIRKFHNKAQLVFHPDKNRDVDYRRRYLSKRISSELSQAFKKL